VTPEQAARASKPAVVQLGAAFGHQPSFAALGERLGLGAGRWPFYFGGRAGVLGTVSAEVVSAACGFFADDLVRTAWAAVLATGRLNEVVRADVELCVAWAREHIGGVPGMARLAELTERVVDAADASGRVLFTAWRTLPDPYEDAVSKVALNLLRLREHRGASHLIAVVANGFTPLQAILGGPGPQKAAANGWPPPYPEMPESSAALAAVERHTDALAGQPFAAISTEERTELVELLDEAYKSWRRRPGR
jgi:hypothetical protein